MAGKSSNYSFLLKLGAEINESFGKATGEAADDLKKVGKAAEESGGGLRVLGDVLDGFGLSIGKLTAGGVAAGIVKGVQYMNDLVDETAELRGDLSKLEQNARDVGQEFGEVNEYLKDFVALTGESDSSVEALSNLMMAGFTGNTLGDAVEMLSAAVIKFPDTLKIESLADSMQETIATGDATGQFEELLGRLGVDTEEFAENLAKCTTEAGKQNFVLQTLAETGIAETAEAYEAANAEMLEYNELAFESEEASAELAEAWLPFANTFKRGWIGFKNILTGFVETAHTGESLYSYFWGADDVEEATEAMTEATEAAEAQAEAVEAVAEAEADAADKYDVAADALDALAEQHEKHTDRLGESVDHIKGKIEELEAAYEAAKDTALESIRGQFKGWDELEYTVTGNVNDLTAALNSQTTYWNTYSTNLELLQSRNIDGLSELVQYMSDGSEDSAAAIASMAWATDEDLQEMVTAYSGLKDSQDRTAENMADLETDYTDSMGRMEDALDSFAEKLDQEDAAFRAAKDTVMGYVRGLNESAPEIAGAYANILSAASQGIGAAQPSAPSMGVVRAEAMMASGGVVTRPTVALVGEGGESEAVLPLSKLESLLDRDAGGQSVNISYAPVITVGAGASGADVEAATRSGFQQFKSWMAQYEREGKRLRFA